MGLLAHTGVPLGQVNCLLVSNSFFNNTSCHSYCKARNSHCDYFLTTTPPHSRATNLNYEYEFYSLAPPPLAGGLFGHWPSSLLLLGWLYLLFLLPLTENKNIHTIVIRIFSRTEQLFSLQRQAFASFQTWLPQV